MKFKLKDYMDQSILQVYCNAVSIDTYSRCQFLAAKWILAPTHYVIVSLHIYIYIYTVYSTSQLVVQHTVCVRIAITCIMARVTHW